MMNPESTNIQNIILITLVQFTTRHDAILEVRELFFICAIGCQMASEVKFLQNWDTMISKTAKICEKWLIEDVFYE
jgi:hypothetical protein